MATDGYEEGYRCGQIALKLLDVVKCRELTSRTYTAVFGFLSPYKDPLRNTIKPLDDAYRLNILTGDLEVSLFGC
jgi:predicted ATPase